MKKKNPPWMPKSQQSLSKTEQAVQKPANQFNPAISSSSQIEVRQEKHSGPLPHPSTLAEYRRIIPNGAERIMQMAEAEGQHRRQVQMENLRHRELLIRNDESEVCSSQVFAFIIVMAALVVALYGVWAQQPTIGALGGVAGLATIIGAFLWKKFDKNQPDKKGADQKSTARLKAVPSLQAIRLVDRHRKMMTLPTNV